MSDTHGPDDTEIAGEHRPSIRRLTRDLRRAAETLSKAEARYLVDAYYISQEDRKRAHNQVRSMPEEPHILIGWLAEQGELLETQIKGALDRYTNMQPDGVWMKSIYGIGPVITAGLLAHIDIEKAPTVGHIYSYAGIAGKDQKPWLKGEKRPFNAGLRTLIWKIGQSFMKFHNQPECVYGAIYIEHKAMQIDRNDRGLNAELCRETLAAKNFAKTTEAYGHYSAGKLPPAQIDARARRFAAKLFLAHMHVVMFWIANKRLPGDSYPHAHLGHVHRMPIPNVGLVPGLREALLAAGRS